MTTMILYNEDLSIFEEGVVGSVENRLFEFLYFS